MVYVVIGVGDTASDVNDTVSDVSVAVTDTDPAVSDTGGTASDLTTLVSDRGILVSVRESPASARVVPTSGLKSHTSDSGSAPESPVSGPGPSASGPVTHASGLVTPKLLDQNGSNRRHLKGPVTTVRRPIIVSIKTLVTDLGGKGTVVDGRGGSEHRVSTNSDLHDKKEDFRKISVDRPRPGVHPFPVVTVRDVTDTTVNTFTVNTVCV